jgi:oligoribonuclease NrnB/cAMP/cGMP phosphodiesterase (DHH superfamily)
MEQDIVIFYHADCLDGFGAAYAAWVKFGETAKYLPIKYGEDIYLKGVHNKQVYMLDYCPTVEVTKGLLEAVKRLIILDHHKTSKETIEEIDQYCVDNKLNNFAYIHDLEHSGCTITWDYFNPTTIPILLQYIEDRDLWKFKLTKTKAICAVLYEVINRDFITWQHYCTLDIAMQSLELMGNTLLIAQDNRIKKQVDQARMVTFLSSYREHKIAIVNSTTDISEIGNELCKRNPEIDFALVYYDDWTTESNKCSLRSIGDFDVANVAKEFGGGGHKNAAGFTTDELFGLIKL